ncbi:hypothetical protein CISIN_1g043070mg, partial [Citrus sinensis]
MVNSKSCMMKSIKGSGIQYKIVTCLDRQCHTDWKRYHNRLTKTEKWIPFCRVKRKQSNVRLDVVKMAEDLQSLVDEGKGLKKAADPLPQPVVEVQDMENTVDVSRLNEVWRLVEDNSVRIICLHGVSRLGKTTLLYNLNKKFNDTRHNFGLVILVKRIQHVMGYRLAMSNEVWDDKTKQGRAIDSSRRLGQRRFALLLDDLREPIDLKTAGASIQNGSKVKYAWNLFQLKVTDDVLNSHRDIRKHAETVAGLCGGLPLSLITTGSAMTSIRNPAVWENAVNDLINYPAEFPGMGDRIFPRLKFSYDHLPVKPTKLIFYFMNFLIFIRKDDLVDLWTGEGLLRDYHNIAAARVQGKSIIEGLVLVCLLEEVEAYFGNFVKMHDMIRDLALWIASEDQENKILAAKSKDELIEEQE